MKKIKIAVAEKNGKLCNGDMAKCDRILLYSINTEKNIIKFEKEEPTNSPYFEKTFEDIVKKVNFVVSGRVSEKLKNLKENTGTIPVAVQSTDNINIALARLADTIKDSIETPKLNRGFYILI